MEENQFHHKLKEAFKIKLDYTHSKKHAKKSPF